MRVLLHIMLGQWQARKKTPFHKKKKTINNFNCFLWYVRRVCFTPKNISVTDLSLSNLKGMEYNGAHTADK